MSIPGPKGADTKYASSRSLTSYESLARRVRVPMHSFAVPFCIFSLTSWRSEVYNLMSRAWDFSASRRNHCSHRYADSESAMLDTCSIHAEF